MKTWKLPALPDESVQALRDASGRVFVRVSDDGEYWMSEELGIGRGTYSWADLLLQRGEVEDATDE